MDFSAIKGRIKTSITTRMFAGMLALVFLCVTLLPDLIIADVYADLVYETITEFERINPVYTETVDNKTVIDDLSLPETLWAVVEVEIPETNDDTAAAETDGDSEDMSETEPPKPVFTQTAPAADEDGDYDYYWYGYVTPANEDELRDAGELVIYTIYYADGTEAYRVHGKYGDMDEAFYECDENGEIFGIVKDIPIAWTCKDYKAEEAGTYTFTAKLADGYEYDGELPTAEITVKAGDEEEEDQDYDDCEEVDCTCGTTTDKHDKNCDLWTPECTCDQADNGHVKGCPLWNPECTCPEETIGHKNPDCPYYVPLADCDCGIDADCKPWQHQEGCRYFGPVECTCKGGEHDPGNTDCLKHVLIQTFSIGGGGTNDVTGDNLMLANTPTSGNAAYQTDSSVGTVITIPGYWIDYVNTIWRNKAYNKFAWTDASKTDAYNSWAWSGNIASQTTGTVTSNQYRTPSKSNSTWTVYSGEQLRYALVNCSSGDTITLGANINMNGQQCNWYNNPSSGSGNGSGVDMTGKTLTLTSAAGDNFTIYNLGVTTTLSTNENMASFIRNAYGLTVNNLTFETAKLVSPNSAATIFHTTSALYSRSLTNVEIKNSLFFGADAISPFGKVNLGISNTANAATMTRCFSSYNYVYGKNHVSGFVTQCVKATISYCGSYGNLLCGSGGHSGGFIPCYSALGDIAVSNCFASNEIYGSAYVSAFAGIVSGTYSNCYVSGEIEGYSHLGGFIFTTGQYSPQTISNCYSTALVGMRSTPRVQGGFAAPYAYSGLTINNALQISNCYAAGEVGNYDVDLNNPQNIGGFLSTTEQPLQLSSLSNCYYDKQTTAMREWASGDSKTVSGITGCLTTSTGKGGTGLASGIYGTDSADPGFKGFANNTLWVYQTENYPQLKVFAEADLAASSWGSQERADIVKAWSLASTSTVFLDTWDEGYDWDSEGERTSSAVSYDRTLASTGKADHTGYKYTYDTVREIVSDFTVTNIAANSTNWMQLIVGGAPAEVTNGSSRRSTNNNIVISSGTGTIYNPGMDWYKVYETVNGQTGYRPLRLISYMKIDAGAEQEVTSGTMYDHRDDVTLTMMDTITDNLVVGLDDTQIWSTAKESGYPDSTGYYAVPTNETNFSASRNAWIYTEIWRAGKDSSGTYVLDADGNYVPEYSVSVTGPGTGSNLTIDEQKWNGEYPLYANTSDGSKYIITYYWMLSDGRYRSDSKVITITPGQYDVTVDVYNLSDDSANSTALYTDTAADSGADTAYSFGTGTSSHAGTLENPYTTNVTAAWKKQNSGIKIEKMTVTMTALDKKTVMGTATITGDIKEGSQITIPITYLYIATEDNANQGTREITRTEVVNITYTIEKDASGGYYLRFNKLANEPENEISSAYQYGDRTGIPDGTKAYVNDLAYNVSVKLWVQAEDTGEVTIEKKLTSPAEEDETFVFQVDYRGSGTTAGSAERTMYAVITIKTGESEGTAKFVDMPAGWYTVTELDSNWRFELLVDELDDDNPTAVVDAANARITMYVEDDSAGCTYQNKRLDVPWANGKDSITNEMPPLTSSSDTGGTVEPLTADTENDDSQNPNVKRKVTVEAVLTNDKKYKTKTVTQVKKV